MSSQTTRFKIKSPVGTWQWISSSSYREMILNRYKAMDQKLRSNLKKAIKKKDRHLSYAKDADKDYMAMIRAEEKTLRNQELLEFGFTAAGELCAFLVSFKMSVGKDLKNLQQATKGVRNAASTFHFAAGQPWTDHTMKMFAEDTLEKLVKESVTRRLLEKTVKNSIQGFAAVQIAKKAAKHEFGKATQNIEPSPIVDGVKILFYLSPVGKDPTKVAKAAIHLATGESVDEAKATHRRIIQDLKDTRNITIAYHKTAALLLDFRISNLQASLVLLESECRKELRSMGL